jgi:hypothetical protein
MHNIKVLYVRRRMQIDNGDNNKAIEQSESKILSGFLVFHTAPNVIFLLVGH